MSMSSLNSRVTTPIRYAMLLISNHEMDGWNRSQKNRQLEDRLPSMKISQKIDGEGIKVANLEVETGDMF